MENKEHWFKSVVFYIPRLIASVMSALAMDDKGLSLKKILAAFGTWVAYQVTNEHACKENALSFTALWLIWVLIVVGIYSAKDVNSLVSLVKGNKQTEEQ